MTRTKLLATSILIPLTMWGATAVTQAASSVQQTGPRAADVGQSTDGAIAPSAQTVKPEPSQRLMAESDNDDRNGVNDDGRDDRNDAEDNDRDDRNGVNDNGRDDRNDAKDNDRSDRDGVNDNGQDDDNDAEDNDHDDRGQTGENEGGQTGEHEGERQD